MLKAEKIPVSYYFVVLSYLGNGPAGRYLLAERVGTTRAKIRRIFEELSEKGILLTPGKSSGRRGTHLTEKGVAIVNHLETLLKLYLDPPYILDETYKLDEEMSIVAIRDKNVDISKITGLFERDSAIRSGATGAVVLVRKGKKWIFPNDGTVASVQEKPEVTENDRMLIVTFAPEKGKANVSAVETALILINQSEIENKIFN